MLLGLKWDDIDLDEGILRVRHTLWEGETTSPKTTNANRCVCLNRMAREALKKQKEKADGGMGLYLQGGYTR